MPLFSSKRENNNNNKATKNGKLAPTYTKQLNEACRQNPPDADTIVQICAACPIASQGRDEYGNTALHVLLSRQHEQAIAHQILPAVVQELLRTWPGAAHAKNLAGSLPLHLAAANHASSQVVQSLLQANAAACKTADGAAGSLPLHEACASKAPFEVVLAIIHAWPEAVSRARGTDASLPLHLACTVTPATFYSQNALSFEVIWNLLEQFPDAVMARDAADDTPYDLLRRGAPRQAELLQLLRTKRAEAQRPVQFRSRPFDRRSRPSSVPRRVGGSNSSQPYKVNHGRSARNRELEDYEDDDDNLHHHNHFRGDTSSTASTMSNTSVLSEDQRSSFSLPVLGARDDEFSNISTSTANTQQSSPPARVVRQEYTKQEKIRVPRKLKKQLAREHEIEI